MFTKGATDNLLSRLVSVCDNGTVRSITDDDKRKIALANEHFSGQGMRVLAFAYKLSENEEADTEDNYIFIGLAAMTDPPRPESKAVKQCKKAGIKVVMITGDHKVTASAIAREIGIMRNGDISLDGVQLDEMTDEELDSVIEKVSVYARVSPDNKIRIVERWQNKGKVVAMTGDGVNDAPALKKADVGVAMGITGTQVSKDAASMILTDDNFATIIKSVANGRAIYANIKNAVKFLLSGNLAAIIAVLCTAIPGLPTPFTAVQLLFINLLTDSLPAIAISMASMPTNSSPFLRAKSSAARRMSLLSRLKYGSPPVTRGKWVISASTPRLITSGSIPNFRNTKLVTFSPAFITPKSKCTGSIAC